MTTILLLIGLVMFKPLIKLTVKLIKYFLYGYGFYYIYKIFRYLFTREEY